MSRMKSYVSKREAMTALTLIVLHFVTAAYVDARDILYDSRGVEVLLWWVNSFGILLFAALLVVIVSFIRGVVTRRKHGN